MEAISGRALPAVPREWIGLPQTIMGMLATVINALALQDALEKASTWEPGLCQLGDERD